MKRILLAVCGLSPQVITETLFALHEEGRSVEEVHVITTREGKDRIFAELLAPDTGHYHRFLKEYGISPASIDFHHRNVHVVGAENGVECPDIADESDNERLLGMCLELACRFTRDADSAVFFSVAGGRKTMSACLTLAAQLYGRPQDRIFHVLVSPEFESNRNFFYPPCPPRMIELRDVRGNPYLKDSRYAEVNLVHLPFVSVRDRLGESFLRDPVDPATLLQHLVREKPRHLVVDLTENKLVYQERELDLRPAHMALYALFAFRKKECALDRPDCRGCTECYLDTNGVLERRERIAEIYRRVAGKRVMEQKSRTGIFHLDEENFRSYKTRIKEAIGKRFGLYAMKDLVIDSTGGRPDTRYGIRLDRSNIKIVS